MSTLLCLEVGGSTIEKDKGFTLIEVIISLGVLIICVVTLLPGILLIYQERMTIQQEEQVQVHLKHTVHHYLTGVSPPKEREPWMVKQEQMNSLTGMYEVCISFEGENGRPYERCLYAKK